MCARLDGIPLAIELAAARCPAPGPAELAARLDGHPGLLAGGPARPGRHRSLEALVTWNYELLGDAERRLLARLPVLRGGFDLGTAERVTADGPLQPEATAGLLASLAGKSLVHLQDGAAVRYSLLQTIRQFAAGRWAGEETAVHLRLLDWALGEARSAEAVSGSRLAGQGVPGDFGRQPAARRWLGYRPGDVTLQAADDLCLGLSFFRAAFDVGAGGGVRAHPGERSATGRGWPCGHRRG